MAVFVKSVSISPPGQAGRMNKFVPFFEKCVTIDEDDVINYCKKEFTMTDKKNFPLNKETYYTFQDFADIIKILRSPEGCPWDREQTFETMKKYLQSESEEVCLAVDRKDSENLCEELGDVLMEILLFSQIAADQNLFTIEDVIDGISRKMIRRHPHVFGDTVIRTAEETEALWKEIKKQEQSEKNPMDSTNP